MSPEKGSLAAALEADKPPPPSRGELRAQKIISIVLLAIALVVLGVMGAKRQVRDGNDFPIYWQAARDFLAGHGLYDVRTGLHGYVYLPWFALLLAPLALLPLPAAAGVWYVANLTFLYFGGRAVVGALESAGVEPRLRVLFFTLITLAGIGSDNLMLGQANPFLFFLVATATRAALSPRADALSGALAGLAAALKMPAAILLAPIALRGRGLAITAFVATVALALALPMLRTGTLEGVRLLDDWRAKVVSPAAAGTLQGSKVIDQSPHAGLRRLLVDAPAFGETHVNVASLSPEQFATVSRGVALALLAAYGLVWLLAPAKATPRALLLDLSLATCAMVQVTGYNLKAQFIVLLLPAWVAASLAWREGAPRGQRLALLATGVLMLSSMPDLVSRTVSNWMLAYSSMAIATLLLAVTLAIQRFAVAATPTPSASPTAAR